MKFQDLFDNWNLKGLKIKAGFAEMEWKPEDADKNAAWDLYVELLTRITTQALKPEEGVEKTALESIHSLFKTTRDILKHYGRKCISFSKVAIIVLNQVVRPFTAKWHRIFESGSLSTEQKAEFKKELAELQVKLISYAVILSKIAGVEDLTTLET